MTRRRTVSTSARRLIRAGWDGMGWLLAVPLATYLRYDGQPDASSIKSAVLLGLALGLVQVVIGFALEYFRGRHLVGSFDEVLGVVLTAGVVTIIGLIVVVASTPPPVPRLVPFIAGALVIGIMLGGRFTFRSFRERSQSPRGGERVIIYGAGDSGEQIARQMLLSPDSGYMPVAFLDDDTTKGNLRIHGVRVVGTSHDLDRVVRRSGATTLVVAIANVRSSTLLELDRRCAGLQINLTVIPTTSEIVGGAVKLGDISHVTEEDLLGRRPIETDEMGIHSFLEGRRILITGAGGSIGSELARQVHRYRPSFVGILDRDESAIHGVQLSIDGQGLLSTDNLILADIRDAARIDEVMQLVRPDIVFHAAALKHLPLLERYPDEAYKTNVVGSANVLRSAARAGVLTFVNISTDKAADPISVLGKTKLETERLTAGVPQYRTSSGPSRYMSVRFGNVLGSRGSVLTTFRYQIEKGGPVTVTDANVTRYFMTIAEAVHLVLQAAVIGEHGETLILDMGEPVRIVDVARQMIQKSGRSIEIVFTGLRDGEKIDEVLIGADESAERRRHPLISHTRVAGDQSPTVLREENVT